MLEVSPRLIAREDALALAQRRWAEAATGPGHLLLIAGEAGIGKSRLLAELPTVLPDDIVIVDAAAFPRDADAAGAVMLALADGLRRAGEFSEAGDLRSRLLDGDETGDMARRRRLLIGDLSEILLGALSGRSVLLRIEDLHWADDLSLEVLERVVAARASHGMIVATFRNDDLGAHSVLGRWRARLLAQRFAEELRLTRLDRAGTAAIAEAVMGTTPSAEFVTSLHERSDGIPLFVEELLAGDTVPDTVVEALASRAASLSAASRAVLDAGSVIGRSFDLDLLAAVTGDAEPALDAELGELLAATLVVASGDLFVFRHALICDAVYGEVLPLRRRELHAAVARAAQHAGLSESYISHHYEKAHDAAAAFDHALAGAREAVRLSGHREAAELFARAMRCAPSTMGLPQRASLHAELAVELAAVDDNDRAAEHLELAIAAYRELADELAAAALVPSLMAALHLLGADLPRRVALAEQALRRIDLLPGGGDSTVRASLYAALAAAYMLDRRLDEALDFGRRAVALLPNSDLAARADLDPTLGSVLVFAGRGEEGWAMLERSIAASAEAQLEAPTARGYRMLATSASVLVDYERAERWLRDGLEYTARTERWNDHYYLLAHRAHVHWARGSLEQAQSAAREALTRGRGITTRITALAVLGYVALDRADAPAARTLLTDALALAEQMGELQRVLPALWGRAEAALLDEAPEAAAEICERALVDATAVTDAAYLFPFVVTGTRAYLALRDVGLARGWLRRCAVLLELRGIPGTLPALDHASGLIELAEGQTGAARELLERASARWAELGRHWEGTHALVDLATCAIRTRRPADAARLVAQVAHGDSAYFSALAEAVGAAEPNENPLSARESEVASLVAAGLTNREIAARLVIAPKTASAHVEHILAKLGASRRAEIAAWVARQ